jgi:uncharacterized protein YxeA
MFDAIMLSESGYRKFTDHLKNADEFWQKRVRSEATGETLYFINLYKYDVNGERWEVDMSFERDSAAHDYVWITMSVGKMATLHNLEAECTQIWQALAGKIYE